MNEPVSERMLKQDKRSQARREYDEHPASQTTAA